MNEKLYPHYLILVGSRNRFKDDFTIKIKLIEGLMADWLKGCDSSFEVNFSNFKSCYLALNNKY